MRLASDVTVTETDDGAVLLDERRGRYWQLNRTGAFVLKQICEGANAEKSAHRLAEREPVSPDDALTDVQKLVAGLRAAGLVVD
ncbi:hypothetical protein GCM10012275_07630 [Longimycelium tulufanense]|uniref:Lasso peptide biosynthesis PqqD family chaperone n=1 Tax=Longimycelium tulufanense TaxID=907463 RepID=A0A8J3FUX4_9PSEU|nr:lasso peptide biosynthesis PqqD family chaperone [Longimycelium tulufanense]GGM39181.1 hypothetical protein GCM10012275_07630 [Longimycelium tulufanense]